MLNNEPGLPTNPAVARLIARLERASAGSGELDALVIAAVAGDGAIVAESTINGRWCVYSSNGRLWEPRDAIGRELRRSYIEERGPTRSLDTALSLVPEGWRVYAIQEACVGPDGEWFAGLDHRHQHYHYGSQMGKAPTPALALSIAALKARSAVPQTGPVKPRSGSNPGPSPNNNVSATPAGKGETG